MTGGRLGSIVRQGVAVAALLACGWSSDYLRFALQGIVHGHGGWQTHAGAADLIKIAWIPALLGLLLAALAWRPRGPMLTQISLGVAVPLYAVLGACVPWL